MNKEKLSRLYGDVKWAGRKRFLGLPWTFTVYILTDSKLITRKGLLNLKEDEVELYRVIDETAAFPLTQRLFGCGTLTLVCADSDTPTKVLKSIKDPRAAKSVIDTAIKLQRDKYYVRGRDMIGAVDSSFSATDSLADDFLQV